MQKMMSKIAAPSRRDYEEFLIRCYFGPGTDYLALAMRRAYLDLNRTLTGMAKFKGAVESRAQAEATLRGAIANLNKRGTKVDQKWFDAWHRAACEELQAGYSEAGFKGFSVGQAQKWLNMTLKYVHTFGEERLPGFAAAYLYCHVPVDRIMLEQLAPYGVQALSVPWSKLTDYAEYLVFQCWVRERFPGSAPLAVEFDLWLRAEPGSSID